LTWQGNLTPTPLSATYAVEVTYRLRESPRVRVVDPPIQHREGRSPPHLYEGHLLCLYLPDSGEWDAGMQLAKTVLPWASEWLLHYEVWLATGDWHGGGVHPQGGKAPPWPRARGSAQPA